MLLLYNFLVDSENPLFWSFAIQSWYGTMHYSDYLFKTVGYKGMSSNLADQ
jgi:hypothetical protein